MKVTDITTYLEGIAPLELQESYDNAGLIVGDHNSEVTGVLISLDATEEVVLETKERGCNLVISHHPIVFKGLKRITPSYYVNRAIIAAIKNDIALYAIHTNLDNVLTHGVNGKIASQLGLSDVNILRRKDLRDGTIGSGCVGTLMSPMSTDAWLQHLKESMKAGVVKYTEPINRMVSKVAICGGSGSFLIKDAIAAKADVYVSADIKYHEYFDANDEIMICDIGHYESEQYTMDLLLELLTKKFPTFALHLTKTNTNPVQYF